MTKIEAALAVTARNNWIGKPKAFSNTCWLRIIEGNSGVVSVKICPNRPYQANEMEAHNASRPKRTRPERRKARC